MSGRVGCEGHGGRRRRSSLVVMGGARCMRTYADWLVLVVHPCIKIEAISKLNSQTLKTTHEYAIVCSSHNVRGGYVIWREENDLLSPPG